MRLNLPQWIVQALYDHTGTMPHEPGSWSGELRGRLSSALGYAKGSHGIAFAGGIGNSDRSDGALTSPKQAETVTSASASGTYPGPSISPTRLSAVEYIQGDAYLWGIGELDANVVLASVAEHLGLVE